MDVIDTLPIGKVKERAALAGLTDNRFKVILVGKYALCACFLFTIFSATLKELSFQKWHEIKSSWGDPILNILKIKNYVSCKYLQTVLYKNENLNVGLLGIAVARFSVSSRYICL